MTTVYLLWQGIDTGSDDDILNLVGVYSSLDVAKDQIRVGQWYPGEDGDLAEKVVGDTIWQIDAWSVDES